jgi:ornithine carbamoyltransferase
MDFLRVGDLEPEALRGLVTLGARIKGQPEAFADALRGKAVAILFQKTSLRTRVSTELGVSQMGGHPIVLDQNSVGLGGREPANDIARVLDRMVDVMALRVEQHGDLEAMALAAEAPVINLLSDVAHPCQAVADLITIAENRSLKGAVVAYVGDGNNMAVSLMHAVVRTGGEFRIANPPGYDIPSTEVEAAERFGTVIQTQVPVEAVIGANVVYTDVWTSMGQEAETKKRLGAFEGYQVGLELFGQAADEAIFLHCLPAHRGQEVSTELMLHPQQRVFDQAENRLYAIKAVLLACMDAPL